MKNALLFLFSILVFSSCSDDDQGTTPDVQQNDPTLLAMAVFNPGATNETHWKFDDDGILTDITSANGTVLKHFEYDSQGRLTQANFFGTTPENFVFTYDSNNRIASVNGMVFTYNTTSGTYIQDFEDPIVGAEFDYFDRYEFNVDASGRLVSEVGIYLSSDGNYDTAGANAAYQNANTVSLWSYGGDSSEGYTYDSHNNPLKAATDAIRRAFAVTHFGSYHDKFLGGMYSSGNNPVTQHYASEDPESHEFEYEYNANGLPFSCVLKNFYLGNPDGQAQYINYYYQGDVQP
ncbi:hypothetical protein [Flavobacterium sp.]|uniref:hypothetical protein n=1 Tax=Flavobacterium sp. TaxID=239 RepID=UPI0025BF9324|nr:hypothetical protein [Flavobacterium sp.]